MTFLAKPLIALALLVAAGGCSSSPEEAPEARTFAVTRDIETVAAAARAAMLDNDIAIDDDAALQAEGAATTRQVGSASIRGTSPAGVDADISFRQIDDGRRTEITIDTDADALRDDLETSLRSAL